MRDMKDSGVAWLSEIPAHWEVVYPKALFRLRKEKAKPGDRQLTASQQYGVIYPDDYMALTGSRVVIVEKDFERLSQKLCKPPDWCRMEAPIWRFRI